ncbi:MAG: IS1595 family transposase [Pyrinomonadaceae bacterium]
MAHKVSFAEIAGVFNDDDKARELLESLRWRDGVRCPHCEGVRAYKITPKEGSKTRKGLWKCAECRKQFTVTVGTIFEGTRVPLGKWLMAIHLICSSKKGVSALQLMRMLWPEDKQAKTPSGQWKKSHYKTAWFMAHRIRYAMTQEPLFGKLKGVVEADETYIGGKSKNMHAKERAKKISGSGDKSNKAPVVTLVERGGKVKTHHVEHVSGGNLRRILTEGVLPTAHLMTDEHRGYREIGPRFAGHDAVNHSRDEYVRGECHVNTSESVHALLKRGVFGTHHHWSKKHLHRYLSEFDFRWNTRKISDDERTAEAITMVGGKRLRYKDPIKNH